MMTTTAVSVPVEKSHSTSESSNRPGETATADAYRTTSRIVGVFFIVATVATSLGLAILAPILDATDPFIAASANAPQVTLGALLLLINCAAVVVIPVMLFPVLKRHNEVSAVGYLGSRIIESLILIVGAISLLSLLTLSQAYAQPAQNSAYLQMSGALLLTIYDWTLRLGIMIVFGLTALILNHALYQSLLVPRWLSGWGLVGATLLLAAGLLEIFGFAPTVLLSLPIALQEMAFAGWLLAKGFDPAAIESKCTN